jgi:hypothetical protein
MPNEVAKERFATIHERMATRIARKAGTGD